MKINDIVKKHWGFLQNSYHHIPDFKLPPIMSFRRNTSLKDRVVKTEIQPTRMRQTFLKPQKLWSFPCLNCINCRLIAKGDTFRHPREPIEVKLKNYLTCAWDWVIYIIWCPCNLLYIGQTTCDLKTRLNNPRYTIRKKRLNLPLSKHFTEKGHNEWDIKCMIVDRIPPLQRGGDRLTKLLKKELEWIFRIKALRPHGLNIEFKTNHKMWG